MALLPASTYALSSTRCTACCRRLSLGEPAIYYDATMPPILLGECCAEAVISALYIDFSRAIELDDIFPSPWIHSRNPKQRADAAKEIYECYERRAQEKASKK